MRIDRDGLRDGEHPLAKPAGTLRIAVLGDSCVEALQVPAEETFVKRLESELAACPAVAGRRVETLNFGVSGYGTAQELITLRREVWKYHPDLVLLAVYPGNDLADNLRALSANTRRPYFVPRGSGLALDDSFRRDSSFRFRTSAPGRLLYGLFDRVRLLQLAKPAKIAFQRWQASRHRRSSEATGRAGQADRGELGLDEAIYQPPQGARWSQAWSVTEALIRAMDDETKAHGAGFGVAILTSGIQVHPDPAVRHQAQERLHAPDLFYPEKRLATLGQAQGIPVLPLAPPLQGLATRDHLFLHGFANTELGQGHWNARGHQAAARLLAPWLCRELLPPSDRSTPADRR